MTDHAQRTPCANCPYRKDAPRKHWSREEFVDLLAKDADPIGATYGCHKKNGNLCIGWLLDQRKRNVPSIALRLHLYREPQAVTQMEEAHDGGAAMFSTVKAMCRANGVR